MPPVRGIAQGGHAGEVFGFNESEDQMTSKNSETPQQRRIQAIRMLADAGMSDQALALAGAPTISPVSAVPVKEMGPAKTQSEPIVKAPPMAGKAVKKTKAKAPKAISELPTMGTIKGSKTPSVIIIRNTDCPPCDERAAKPRPASGEASD